MISLLCNEIMVANRSIWPMNETLTGTTNPNQSGPGSNNNDGELSSPQNFRVKVTL